MSFSVAKQPSTDMKQLMTSGRTGMGDIISGFLANWFLPDRNHVCSYCDAASLRAGDGLALTVITEVRETYQAIISEQKASL